MTWACASAGCRVVRLLCPKIWSLTSLASWDGTKIQLLVAVRLVGPCAVMESPCLVVAVGKGGWKGRGKEEVEGDGQIQNCKERVVVRKMKKESESCLGSIVLASVDRDGRWRRRS